MDRPFIKFYPRDWDADAELLRCSLAARGLWVHMIRVMHEAQPYGFFVGRAGEPIDISDFARRICATPREVRKCLEELRNANVPGVDSHGRIFSRRLVREEARRLEGLRAAGRSIPEGPTPSDPQGSLPLYPRGSEDHDPRVRDRARARTPAPSQKPEAIARARDSDSLRSSALGFGDWPGEIAQLRALAMLFIAEFANCRDATKAEKYVGVYTTTLATMRSRHVSIEAAWQACADARDAFGGKPLFQSAVKMAISFLPSPGRAQAPSRGDAATVYGRFGSDE